MCEERFHIDLEKQTVIYGRPYEFHRLISVVFSLKRRMNPYKFTICLK